MHPGRQHYAAFPTKGALSAPVARRLHYPLYSSPTVSPASPQEPIQIESPIIFPKPDSPNFFETPTTSQQNLDYLAYLRELKLSPNLASSGHITPSLPASKFALFTPPASTVGSTPLSSSSASEHAAYRVPEIPSIEPDSVEHPSFQRAPPSRAQSEQMGLSHPCFKTSSPRKDSVKQASASQSLGDTVTEIMLERIQEQQENPEEDFTADTPTSQDSSSILYLEREEELEEEVNTMELSPTRIYDETLFGAGAAILMKEEGTKDGEFGGVYEFNCPTSKKVARGSRKDAVNDMAAVYWEFHSRGWQWLHPTDRAHLIIYPPPRAGGSDSTSSSWSSSE